MKCPQCESQDLVMTDRQGIEIDYCPKCRGVWLDRGELDKIIERSSNFERPAAYEAQQPYRRADDDDDEDHRRYDRPRDGQGYPPPQYPKRKSFWSELFD